MGAMIDVACAALDDSGYTADVWNPFILKPMILGPIIESVRKTGRLLVVQESNEIAGLGDAIISRACAAAFASLKCAPRLVAPEDMPVPFARELETWYLPDQHTVGLALEEMLESGK
jgi:pyruvate/2-oxoglutarate/acetoin dehydrogenase E1 component